MKKIFFSFLFLLTCFSLSAQEVSLTKIGEVKCGRQPKQVLFSPDSRYIVMPLLDDEGFDVFDVLKGEMLDRIKPPESNNLGFAEGLFIPEKKCFFVSQMTTGKIHEYSYPGFKYKRSVSTGGEWSKFIAWSSEKQILAVSNWVTNDISIIEYASGKVLRRIKAKAAPRGLFFYNGGTEIISLAFDGGVIEKFNVETGKRIDSISVVSSAMRHITVDTRNEYAYVSDMFHKKVYKINLDEFEIESSVEVFKNPNTIDLLNDRYLFVSTRGPNNPDDYTKRSPENGKIQVVDVIEMKVIKEIEGGNQPTGLDVDNSGNLLCFSNFQDENIELYKIDIQ